MAQTLTFRKPPSSGMFTTLKVAALKLENTAGETTYTLTAALAGMSALIGAVAIDETAAAAIRGNPTVDATTNLITQVAFTFTAGDELTILAFGY